MDFYLNFTMKCFIFLAIVLLTSAGAFTGSQPGRDGEIKKDDDLSITTIRPLSISSVNKFFFNVSILSPKRRAKLTYIDFFVKSTIICLP